MSELLTSAYLYALRQEGYNEMLDQIRQTYSSEAEILKANETAVAEILNRRPDLRGLAQRAGYLAITEQIRPVTE